MRMRAVAMLLGLLAAVGLAMAACGATDRGNDQEQGTELPSVAFAARDGSIPLLVEVADTRELITCGLMHRDSLSEDRGMLFLMEHVYGSKQAAGFWNRNTLIHLSVLYIAADGTIVDILDMDATPHPGAQGVSQPNPRESYSFVIEVNRGWHDRHGVSIGTHVDVSRAAARGSAGQPPALCREHGF